MKPQIITYQPWKDFYGKTYLQTFSNKIINIFTLNGYRNLVEEELNKGIRRIMHEHQKMDSQKN